MNISLQEKIGEIVRQDYRTATLFKEKGIDFCCRGNRTLAEVIDEKGLKAESILDELERIIHFENKETLDFKLWPLDLIVDYIEKKHHRYVRQQIPIITAYLDQIVKAHGHQHPALKEVRTLFVEGGEELMVHMESEETILFPMIRELANVPINEVSHSCAPIQFFRQMIQSMMNEHEVEGNRWRIIEKLTQEYQMQFGCNVTHVTFQLLREFQEDLHMHIHLENNILFPGALELKDRKIKALQS
ncbi:MAG: DUF542 domain-containing protein [Bacteroidota bacterium]|nr:DUF542 domain-containing protein [Bacteroidota bacterium]